MQASLFLILLGTMTVTGASRLPTAPVHEVKLVHQGDHYGFEPSTLTVHSGDLVKFTLVSGGPHNVAFDADQIPDAREQALAAGMPDQMAPLASNLLKDGEGYTISFAGVPPGTYPYFCMPHAGAGMKGSITVE
jgi:plastocyanin